MITAVVVEVPQKLNPFSLSHDSPHQGVIMINSDKKQRLLGDIQCERRKLVLYETYGIKECLGQVKLVQAETTVPAMSKILPIQIFARSSVLLVLKELMIRTGSSLGTNKVFSA